MRTLKLRHRHVDRFDMPLTPLTTIALPQHTSGGFEHADVHFASGQVYVAHTANGTVEVIDGEKLEWKATLQGFPDGTGLICAQDVGLIFAASGGAGKIAVIEPASCRVTQQIAVGPRPAGLAWDPLGRRLLNVDLEDYRVRIIDFQTGRVVAINDLPGRPRWPVWDPVRQRFLVNVREPAAVVMIEPGTAAISGVWGINSRGPHGLDVDPVARQAFVACDAGVTLALDLATGTVRGSAEIGGEPDVIWFNPDASLLYVAIGNPGQVDVIDTVTMSVVDRLTTSPEAHSTAFDRKRQRLYVFAPDRCEAQVFEHT